MVVAWANNLIKDCLVGQCFWGMQWDAIVLITALREGSADMGIIKLLSTCAQTLNKTVGCMEKHIKTIT